MKVTSRLAGAVVGVGLLVEAGDEPEPIRSSKPSKVTRAFSALQLVFSELKWAKIKSEDKGILKLALAPNMSLGMASPMVTFE